MTAIWQPITLGKVSLPNRFVMAPMPRKKVEVFDCPDGRIEIRWQGLSLRYRTFDRIRRVDRGTIVEDKRLSEAPPYSHRR